MKVHTFEIDLDGRKISIETGKIAKQAGGSVVVRCGDSVVLVTATTAAKPKPNQSFFPLTCDYREYTYAAGKIPGGYIKREGRQSEKETLTSRMMDRPMRPLFPEGYLNETQIIAMVLSADPEQDPSTLALVGAGAALAISDIPFHHLVSAVRVGMVDGKYVANPSYSDTRASKLNILVAATEAGIVMVEAGAQQASEEEVLGALEFGHNSCKKIIEVVKQLVAAAGKTKREFTPHVINETLAAEIDKKFRAELTDALDTKKYEKLESYARVDALHARCEEEAAEDQKAEAGKLFDALKEKIFRDQMLDARRRPDGRGFEEIRPIWSEVGALPRTHGSALFTRGETQALVVTTLGTERDAQRIDALAGEYEDRFLLHYNMPPFATGETGRVGTPKRREIGHGRLAKRALVAVLPSKEDFPYTMRVVSEITESNGSSSMASVCGGCLSLMDAGVPIKAHVAGIAMGLIKEENRFAVLTDILGDEDHLGDMDFKVAGTTNGITALQMDIKIQGITKEIMQVALAQAKEARMHILGKMQEAMAEAKTEVSNFAPRLFTMKINPEKIRDVIGKGGAVIRALTEETGTQINIDEDGTITIAATDPAKAEEAKRRIEQITAEVEIGKIYEGPITKILDFGALVNLLPGKDGLLHISQIAHERVEKVSDYLSEGQIVRVKVMETDEKGRIKLSMKVLLDRPNQGGPDNHA